MKKTEDIITLTIDGPIIKEEYPLREVIYILDNIHFIVDQSYLVLAKKNRMTHEERINFKILASRTQPGSLIQDLRIVYDVTAPLSH